MNAIKVIVPVYNSEKWISKTIESIKSQTYKNFECLIADDMSTDNTVNVIMENIKDDKRFSAVINMERKYALKNVYDGFKELGTHEEDILVTVDGDDWLYDEFVFEKVVATYMEKGCLLTYGSFIEYPSGVTHPYYMTPYSDDVIDNSSFREVPYKASHLRTFKKKLFDKLKKEDLTDDSTGKFYDAAGDLAQMYPLIEMAGDRSAHIGDILYVYNKQNPLSEMYCKLQHHLAVGNAIKKLPKYTKIEFLNGGYQ